MTRPERKMSTTLTLSDTTIGKKYVMAASGIVLFGFVIGHMVGNLQLFLGPQVFNDYSKFLHETPSLLWGTRIVLVLAVTAHIVTSLQLTLLNQRARPVGYKVKRTVATTYAARTMVWSGPLVLLYIVYHIAHLTLGVTEGLAYTHDPVDVYSNVVRSFQVPLCAAVYVVANVALGVHLYHGAWSILQSLGFAHPRYNDPARSTATAIALATTLGFLAVPIAVQAGLVKLVGG